MYEMINNFPERLVELVAKHKILYDHTLEGYSTYPAQDEIWQRIADELKEDVSACKLKWKNIRSCYTRHLRQLSSQKKRSRSYYLAKHLAFLQPFCKPRGQISSYDSGVSEDGALFHYEDQDSEPLTKCEPPDEDSTLLEWSDANVDEEERKADELNANSKRQHEFETIRKRESQQNDCESAKRQKFNTNADESDLNFFKSLLPDVRKMNGKQKNRLKIAILNAIDGILYKDNT